MKEWFFSKLAYWSTQHPWRILGIVAVLSLLAFTGATQLTMEMSQLSLLPDDAPISQEYKKILHEFEGGVEQITLVVEARTPEDQPKLPVVAQALVEALEPLKQQGYLRHIFWKIPQDFVANHGFMLQKAKDLKRMLPQMQDLNLGPFLSAYNDDLEKTYVGGEDKLSGSQEIGAVAALEGIDQLLQGLTYSLQKGADSDSAQVKEAIRRFWMGDLYLYSADRRMIMITAQTMTNMMDSMFVTIASVKKVDSVLHEVESRYPEFSLGMTGMSVIQKDEMDASTRDSSLSTILAFAIILILLIVAFRMWVAPVLAGGALILGVLWAAGIAGWTIGRLNMSTAFFAVYLVGLGIDFCIHYMHGYLEAKSKGMSLEDAVREALLLNASGIVTGGLTTSLAFLTLMLTNFEMFQEMGFIAGVGVLSCVVTALVVLPAGMFIWDRRLQRRGKYQTPELKHSQLRTLRAYSAGIIRFRWIGLASLTMIILIAWKGLNLITFNTNIMDLEPEGLESIELQHRLLDAYGQSTENAVFTVPSLDSAWQLQRLFEEERMVGRVESPASICPPTSEQQQRRTVLQQMRQALAEQRGNASSQQNLSIFREELERLEANLIEMSQSAYLSQQDRIVRRADRITGLDSSGQKVHVSRFDPLFHILDSLDPQMLESRLSTIPFKDVSLQILYQMTNPAEITWDSVPEIWRQQFLSKDGSKYLMNVYPKQDVWDNVMENPFLNLVEREVPHATGMLSLMKVIYERSRDEGRKAILYSLVAIFVLMLIHFRKRPWLGILAMTPMALGMVLLMGCYGWAGIPLNMMSIMALPMIIGIGVDDGIHICHRYQARRLQLLQQGAPSSTLMQEIPEMMSHVGHAVFLTTLTTAIAFGSLMFGVMRANQSLGAILTIGVWLCYFVGVSLLPMVFSLFTGRKS